MAMDLLQAGVDRSVIGLWLGHERVETTQIYLVNYQMAWVTLTHAWDGRGRSSPGETKRPAIGRGRRQSKRLEKHEARTVSSGVETPTHFFGIGRTVVAMHDRTGDRPAE